MQDSIIKGNGNSRYLKSVSNFLTLYPTYADFAAALVAGTLPIDFNGINASGFTTLGTPINKATMLTDATAAKVGSATTPNEALSYLADNVKSGASAPTGTANTGAIYVDTAANDIYIYDGTAWRRLTLGVEYTTQTITEYLTASQTWTVPTNITGSIAVTCIGGGGGGGGATTDYTTYGQGGGAGSKTDTTVTLAGGNTVSVTVGQGGAGANNSGIGAGNSGSAGDATSFGNYASANGGAGGDGSNSTDYTSAQATGATGYTYNGSVFGNGGNGGHATSPTRLATSGGAGIVVLTYDVLVATPV